MACLNPDQLSKLVLLGVGALSAADRTPDDEEAEEHCDGCSRCRIAVEEMAKATGDSSEWDEAGKRSLLEELFLPGRGELQQQDLSGEKLAALRRRIRGNVRKELGLGKYSNGRN